ncbi:PASTA domain-containing protein [Paenibacillus sp. J2TS4]|uniref:PASTA domain-containing protein n=1 Tax=Paenibacillus sp. J2TS4 TaxID=2807194 RepID=UPI001B03F250|nr:PASTA domain-containing protein [Paenibacillus sp. J2TS4]GIP32172.1 hypothetical protein J2TS4_13820 [Paenibacillus sp. J2TS4]
MELLIGKRYSLVKQKASLMDGFLYSARDISLQRDVFLFLTEKPGESATEIYFHTIGEAARINDERFIHILDAGVDKDYIFISLHACEGYPLLHDLTHPGRTSRDILALLFELGRGLQEAAENDMDYFSVTAENIWCHNGTYKFINYWTEGAKNRKGVKGLCILLYQLSSRSAEIPLDLHNYEQQLRETMSDLPMPHREKLMAIVRRAMNGEESLPSFLFGLHDLIVGSEQEPRTYIPSRSTNERLQMKADKDAPHSMKAAVEEPIENREEEDSDKKSTSPTRKIFIAGVSVVCVVLIIGVFLQKTKGDLADPSPSPPPVTTPGPDSTEPPAITDNDNPDGSSDNGGQTKEKDKTGDGNQEGQQDQEDPPTDAGDEPDEDGAGIDPEQAIVPVPNLIGLSREEAEQTALDNGLRYEYHIENNDEQPQGNVFKQEPAAAEEVPKGTNITFWVSR